MEELIDIDYDKEKLKTLKENVDKSEKNNLKKEIISSKENKKIKNENKYQKYIILFLSALILFISYHFLLQYSENLKNSLYIEEKLILNYEENLKGRERELNSSISENNLLKKEIEELKTKYIAYKKQYEILKMENDKIVNELEEIAEINRKYKKKYDLYLKYFKNLSETFHSFFEEN